MWSRNWIFKYYSREFQLRSNSSLPTLISKFQWCSMKPLLNFCLLLITKLFPNNLPLLTSQRFTLYQNYLYQQDERALTGHLQSSAVPKMHCLSLRSSIFSVFHFFSSFKLLIKRGKVSKHSICYSSQVCRFALGHEEYRSWEAPRRGACHSHGARWALAPSPYPPLLCSAGIMIRSSVTVARAAAQWVPTSNPGSHFFLYERGVSWSSSFRGVQS